MIINGVNTTHLLLYTARKWVWLRLVMAASCLGLPTREVPSWPSPLAYLFYKRRTYACDYCRYRLIPFRGAKATIYLYCTSNTPTVVCTTYVSPWCHRVLVLGPDVCHVFFWFSSRGMAHILIIPLSLRFDLERKARRG